jgi:TetR/AcrR family transcriptional repressor of nem operon
MAKSLTSRERLVAAGLSLIHARSYTDVSVDDICRQAKVNKGSFYHCFKSKTDLALAILDAQEQDYLGAIMGPAFMNDAPPLEKIGKLFALFAKYQQDVKTREGRALGCLFGNLALELSSTDERVRDRVRAGMTLLVGAVEQTLLLAMERGDLPRGDAAIGAEQIVAYLHGLLLWSKLNDDPARVADLARQSIAIALPGSR